MAETRVIIGHAQHQARGPHFEMPAGFVPLRLIVESEGLAVDVTCQAVLVGRHTDADLRFAFPDVSRRHCRLAYEKGQWRIHDLQSVNGTYVNNEQIVEATLYTGDMIRLGCVKLLVKSATPVRLSKAEEEKNAKLRQIAEVLPSDDTPRAA
jgi:pSer/pThr/pTyr-binding forkhead associated (FHA) protein